MEELTIVVLWGLASAVLGTILVVVFVGPLMLESYWLIRLVMRVPGELGRRLRKWEQNDPGTPMAVLTCVQGLTLLVVHCTGLLWRLVRIFPNG